MILSAYFQNEFVLCGTILNQTIQNILSFSKPIRRCLHLHLFHPLEVTKKILRNPIFRHRNLIKAGAYQDCSAVSKTTANNCLMNFLLLFLKVDYNTNAPSLILIRLLDDCLQMFISGHLILYFQ